MKCHYAGLHDDKRGVCKYGFDLYSGVCIKNGCSKSVNDDEDVDKIKDLIKD